MRAKSSKQRCPALCLITIAVVNHFSKIYRPYIIFIRFQNYCRGCQVFIFRIIRIRPYSEYLQYSNIGEQRVSSFSAQHNMYGT